MSALKSLINLSQAAARAPELTQGGGGNTSVKKNGEMLIKASGFRLDEVSETAGFVNVNFQPVQLFLQKKTNELLEPDKELKQFVNEQIAGDKTFLPSMETGFHAVLKDYVIHTHPVAVNSLLCCKEGITKMEAIFKDENISVLPSLLPGYFLSKAIADMDNCTQILFLQNHGLIVHGDSEEEVILLHGKVIAKLDKALNFNYNFLFELEHVNEGLYEFKSDMLQVYFSQPGLLSSVYFPDQAVVIGNDFIYTNNNVFSHRISFNTESGRCFIKTNPKNALAIAENLVALANIAAYAGQHTTTLNPLPDADVAYILGMDMEKYRQGLLK